MKKQVHENDQTLPEMTSTGSVGVGLASPLAVAGDYVRRFRGSGIRGLLDFLKSRGIKRRMAEEVQSILINQFREYGVSGSLASLEEEVLEEGKKKKLVPVTPEEKILHLLDKIINNPAVHASIPIGSSITSKKNTDGAAIVIQHKHVEKSKSSTGRKSGAIQKRDPKPKQIGRSTKARRPKASPSKRSLKEGLGYADDADGRGKGLSGGSPYGSDGPTVTRDEYKCPKCGSSSYQENSDGSKTCNRCNNTYGLPYLQGQTTNNGTFGNVRVPGGPIDTNEVRITCLDTNLYEITANGVTTMHARPVLPEALKHRVSTYGSTYKMRLQNVLEWVWTKAKPGDTIVFDHNGKAKYVVGESGFKYGMD